MKSWELERIYREGGLEQGIDALVTTCQEFKISREDTLGKVMYNFKLEQEAAEAYMKKYWQE